jgi:hypothetical protein
MRDDNRPVGPVVEIDHPQVPMPKSKKPQALISLELTLEQADRSAMVNTFHQGRSLKALLQPFCIKLPHIRLSKNRFP